MSDDNRSGENEAIELRKENRRLRKILEDSDQGKILLRQQEEFSQLLALSKLIVSEPDVDAVFELVASNARQIVNAELVLVPMLDEQRLRYTYVAASGVDADLVRGTSHKANVGMCGWVLHHERSLLFGEESPHWMDEKTPWEEGQQSAVLVPLFGRQGIIGGLSALGKRGGGPFTGHDLDLLTMFANQVSIAVEDAKLFEQRLRSEQGLKAINDCFLSFGVDPRENIKAITATAGTILDATGTIYVQKEGDLLKTLAAWRLPTDMPLSGLGLGPICLDLLDREGDQPLIVDNLQNSPYAEADPTIRKYGLREYVGYPVRSAGKPPSAALCAMFRDPVKISPYLLDLLQVLGRAAAVEEERLRAGLALQATEARFRAIIENSPVGVIAAEAATGRFMYVNQVICHMLGYGREELLSMDVTAIHPAEVLPEVKRTFEGRDGIQTTCLRKDGSRFSVDIKPVEMELDGIDCLVGFFTDITDRQLLEAERIKSQKLEAVGNLAGGIAHDFNNLMQTIFGNIYLARMSLDPDGESSALLNEAEGAMEQAVSLTNQLLTFSRGGKPVRRLSALGPLIEQSARFILSGSSTGYTLDVPSELWPAEVDGGQIGQVIQNIVLNADQAMHGSGVVTLSAKNLEKDDPAFPPGLPAGPCVRIGIADQGGGIPAAHLERIFDPYFTTKEKGSGLGLATAYSIVKNHDGIITVSTDPGEGSTFTIYLPACPEKVAYFPSEAESVAQESADAPLRILVMDDDQTVRELCSRMLSMLGHGVSDAAHGEEALEAFRKAMADGAGYDLVILDLTIRGGMGGVETLKAIRALDPEIRALVSSGYSDDSSMGDFLEEGFNACLKKPYTLDTLRKALDEVMG